MKVLLASLLLFAANKRTGAAARLSQHEMPQGRLQRSIKQRRNEFFSYRAPFASESNPPTQKPPTTKPASHPPSRWPRPKHIYRAALFGSSLCPSPAYGLVRRAPGFPSINRVRKSCPRPPH